MIIQAAAADDLQLLTFGNIKVFMKSGVKSVSVPVGKSIEIYLETVLETGVSDFDSTWYLDLDDESSMKVP